MRLTALLPLTAALFLYGCSDQQDDLRNWMAEASKDLKPNLKPLPPIQQVAAVSYQGASLIDPFKVSKLEPDKKSGVFVPDANRRREPLEAPPPNLSLEQAEDRAATARRSMSGSGDPLENDKPSKLDSRATTGDAADDVE